VRSDRKLRVLFVCLGNSCRSPMAEAIARQVAPDLWEATSGGLTPLGYIAEPTIATLAKNNVPAEGLASKAILHAHWQEVDFVINMSGFPKEQVFEDFEKVEDWYVEDPFGSDSETYQRIFEEIQTRIKALTARLSASAKTRTSRTNPRRAR